MCVCVCMFLCVYAHTSIPLNNTRNCFYRECLLKKNDLDEEADAGTCIPVETL